MRAAAALCVALAAAAAHHALGGTGSEDAPPPERRRAAAPRVQRYHLAAFRSESPDRVQVEGAWWPEWEHHREGLRSSLFGEPGGRLRFRIAGFAGGRLEGRIEVRAQIAGDARAGATATMRLESAGRSTRIFDRTLAPGASAPFAIDLPADLAADAVLELSVERGNAAGALANVAWIEATLTRTLPRTSPPIEPARSIVLITADTLRQDEIGPYGGLTRTPALDRLAGSGATFLDAHSVAFGTAPSHASLMTSSPASEHGVYDNASVLGDANDTLAEVLAAAGYATVAFVSSTTVSRALGFDQGFDYYGDVFALDPGAGCRASYHERPGELTVTRFLDWLSGRQGERFFAWIHLYDAHQPYLPPPGWVEPYLPVGPAASLRFAYPRAADGSPVYLDARAIPAGVSLAALGARAHAEYRGEIAYLDAQVGRVLDALARSGNADAVVAFVADHGENFLEHGPALAFGHQGLHAEVTRLPLLLAAPGRIGAGERRAGLATNLDLAPTLLELAGVPAPPGWRGHSLLRAAAHEAIVLEGAAREEIGVRTVRWLLTVEGPAAGDAATNPAWTEPGSHVELYDLAADPGETRNVYRAGHPAAAALAALVGPFRPAPPPAAGVGSESHAEALRVLGYLR